MKEKISCIVTTYNRLSYLKNLIICLKNQSLQPDELIIADDGSSENLMENISVVIGGGDFL